MKEAAGEANMTVITIVLIGVVAAAGLVLVPRLIKNSEKRTACIEMGGTWKNDGKCYFAEKADGSSSYCTLTYCAKDEKYTCVNDCK